MSCPNCGSKFSHDDVTLQCGICGLPDEIIALGPRYLSKWRKKEARRIRSKREAKRVIMLRDHPTYQSRKRKGHGRQ